MPTDDSYVQVHCFQCGRFLGWWEKDEKDLAVLCYDCEYGYEEDDNEKD